MATTTYYPLSDLLYRTATLTDDGGVIQETYDTDAYGNTQIYSGPGPDDDWFSDDDQVTDQPICEYIFTGRQYDPESQIYFYRARYYHPVLGRFVSRDPQLFKDGMNIYLYARANPLLLTDPKGTAPMAYLTYPYVGAPRGQFTATMTARTAPSGALDPYGADMDIKFKPNNEVTDKCLCTEISFTQYYTDTWQDWGFWHFNAWQQDGTDPYSIGLNKPWTKGAPEPNLAHMQDSPGSNVHYWKIDWKAQAICRKGKEAGKSYGTLDWGLVLDNNLNVKLYKVDGNSTWMPITNVTTSVSVSGYVPTS